MGLGTVCCSTTTRRSVDLHHEAQHLKLLRRRAIRQTRLVMWCGTTFEGQCTNLDAQAFAIACRSANKTDRCKHMQTHEPIKRLSSPSSDSRRMERRAELTKASVFKATMQFQLLHGISLMARISSPGFTPFRCATLFDMSPLPHNHVCAHMSPTAQHAV